MARRKGNIRLAVRDSKGRYSTLGKAKYFYIYVDGVLEYRGVYGRVSDRIGVKEEEAYFYLNAILGGIRKELKTLKSPKLKVIKKSKGFKGPPKKLPKKKPKIARKPRRKAKTFVREQEIYSKRLDSEAKQLVMDYVFDKKIPLTRRNIDAVMKNLRSEIALPAKKFFDMKKGLQMFQSRMRFEYETELSQVDVYEMLGEMSKKDQGEFRKLLRRSDRRGYWLLKNEEAIGTLRTERATAATPYSLGEFKEYVLDDLIDQVEHNYRNYLKESITRDLKITGIEFTNMFEADIYKVKTKVKAKVKAKKKKKKTKKRRSKK